MNPSPPTSAQGSLLAGRYLAVRLLGAGAMGEVYLAKDTFQADKVVALKLLKESSTVGWFKSEFQTLTLMAHPFIAGVYDFAYDTELKAHFYTCEYVDGLPADQALQNTSLQDKLDFLTRFLYALDYIHAQGYLHCDVKPANVLVTRAGDDLVPKVLDFGLATDMPKGTVTSRGTPHYMAPEWFTGGVPGAYTDIYSAGIMFYRILFGELPFSATNTKTCIEFHTKGQMQFPSHSPYPAWLHTLLQRMTARDIKERIPSAAECLTAIAQMSGMSRLAGSTVAMEVADEGVGGPWLGRQQPLATVLGSLKTLAENGSGDSPLWVISSPGGRGHTRFLTELRRRLQVQGFQVHALSAIGGSSNVFHTLCRTLLPEAGQGELKDERVSHTVARLVEQALAAAAARPVIYLVDDADHLDDPSATFFRELLNRVEFGASRGTRSVQAAVVVTQPERQSPTELNWLKHRLARHIALPELEADLLPRFLRLVLRTPEIPDVLVTEAQSTCTGNPKLLVEYVAFLRRTGTLTTTPQRTEFHSQRLVREHLPKTVSDFLEHSLACVEPKDFQLLEVTALAWEPVGLQGLCSVTQRQAAEVGRTLDQLQKQGLLHRSNASHDVELQTESLRNVVLSKVDPDRKLALHRQLAEWFGTQPGHEDAYTWHLMQAKAAGLSPNQVLKGIEVSMSRLAFHRTLLLLDAAESAALDPISLGRTASRLYRLWGRYDEGVERLGRYLGKPGAQRADDLRVELAELHFRAGRYADSYALLEPLAGLSQLSQLSQEPLESATQEFDAASVPSKRAPCASDSKARAVALASRVLFYLGKHEESRQVGEQGMAQLPPESREFCLCAAMVGLVRVYGGKLQQGAKFLETALANLRPCGGPSDMAFVANALGLAYHRMKDFPKARHYYGESLSIARACGDTERVNVAIMNLSVVLQESGDYAEAIARYEEALAQAFQTENLPVLARIYGNLGNIHRYLGMLQKAKDYAQRSLELATRLNQPLLRSLNTMLLGEIALFSGDFGESLNLLQQSRSQFVELKAPDEETECLIDLSEAALLSAQSDFAVQHGESALALAKQHSLPDHECRASLSLSKGLMLRNRPADMERAESLLNECLGLLQGKNNLELELKQAIFIGQVQQRLGAMDKAAGNLTKAVALMDRLRQKIPGEFGNAFFSRRDRRELQADLARLQAGFTQLEATMVPGSGMLSIGPDPRVPWMSELIRLYRKLLGQREIEQVLEAIIDVTVDLSGAERGFVLLPSTGGFDVVVARNMDREGIRKSRTKFSTSVARQVLETGELLLLEDAIEADDFREQRSIVANRIRSVACLPLPGRDGPLGALYLDNRFKPGVFSEGVVEMLRAFAEQAALAVETNRLIANYRSMVEALEKSKEEVARLNRELQETVDTQKAMLDEKESELQDQQEQLASKYGFSNFVGNSAPMMRLFGVLARVKDTPVPVLVMGESGTGKELVARALHFGGPRKNARFVSINCAALPDTLLESELFGYVRGAFTGAHSDKRGLFAVADQGTLFLDEVGDMSLALQAKVLRVIQEGEYTPLGSTKTFKADVRIVSATNRDLAARVKEGLFRQDLYYRLDVVSVEVPPLRSRKEDIPLLIEHFLSEFARRNGSQRPRLHPEAMKILMDYEWPGNVRELQSVVQTAAVFAERGLISVEALRTKPEVFSRSATATLAAADMPLDLKTLEQRAIETALARCRGNKVQAAKLLGISRRALYNKLNEE